MNQQEIKGFPIDMLAIYQSIDYHNLLCCKSKQTGNTMVET